MRSESALSPIEPEEEETLVQRLRTWLSTNLGGKAPDSSLKEALEEVLEEHEEHSTTPPEEEQKILKKVLQLDMLSVSDIMTPRSDIKAAEYTTSFQELKAFLIQTFHTRIPVYNETLDNIKGFIHIKDMIPMFSGDVEFNMAFILREILFVPPSMKVADLLVKMRKAGVHIAIVIDEYGGTDGLVTLEDVFEEIVGDIQDEHDEDELEDALSWNTQGFCDVEARVRIEKLEKDLGITLSSEEENADYDTLGGLIFYKSGHVPIAGETIEQEDGVRFEIIAADPRLIKKVRIYRPQPS